MSSEKYVNYYIDTMTQTMNEFLSQSISLKSNLRIIEESLNEQISLNEKLRSELENANSLLEQKENQFTEKQSEEIGSLHYELDVLREQKVEIHNDCENAKNQLNNLRIENQNLRNDCITLASQAQHVETFRNELLRARNENDELRKTIESLTKKLEVPEPTVSISKKVKTPETKEKTTPVKNTKPIKDGGTF